MHQDKVTLELVNSQEEHETLVTTTEHPFFVKALGFTPAGNLKAGMVLSHHTPEKGNNLHAAAVSVDNPNELHIQKVTASEKRRRPPRLEPANRQRPHLLCWQTQKLGA